MVTDGSCSISFFSCPSFHSCRFAIACCSSASVISSRNRLGIFRCCLRYCFFCFRLVKYSDVTVRSRDLSPSVFCGGEVFSSDLGGVGVAGLEEVDEIAAIQRFKGTSSSSCCFVSSSSKKEDCPPPTRGTSSFPGLGHSVRSSVHSSGTSRRNTLETDHSGPCRGIEVRDDLDLHKRSKRLVVRVQHFPTAQR